MAQPTLEQALQIAIQHHQAGRLSEAERIYRQILALQPTHADAMHLLGVIAYQVGRPEVAVGMIRRAIAINPSLPAAHGNLGSALNETGQVDEAIDAFRRAIALQPDRAEIHRNLAGALYAKGMRGQALAAYQEALRLKPDDETTQFELAVLTGNGAVRTTPRTYVRSLFDHYAAKFDDHLVKHLFYRIHEELFDAVRSVDQRECLDIMDLGCGTGLCGTQFRPYSGRLVGVDLSPRMLEQAAKRKIYDELIEADLSETLRARPGQWDVLLAGDVFIYVGDLDDVMAAAGIALRPGGLLAFSLEKHDGDRYVLHERGRFAHSIAYIRDIASRNSFEDLITRAVTLRQHSAVGVEGWIVVLRLASAGKPR